MCGIFQFVIFYSPLTPEQRAEQNALVTFIIKDQDFMGLRDEFISETFVHFKDIPTAQEGDLDCLPQIKLNMTVPKSTGTLFSVDQLVLLSYVVHYFITIMLFVRFENS